MITNTEITLYHLARVDVVDLDEKYTRYNIAKAWWFGGKGASTNKGYTEANDVQIRIPYNQNENLGNVEISIGDIVVNDHLDFDIDTQQDLQGYEYYNITAINDNTFGSEPHIHLSGK